MAFAALRCTNTDLAQKLHFQVNGFLTLRQLAYRNMYENCLETNLAHANGCNFLSAFNQHLFANASKFLFQVLKIHTSSPALKMHAPNFN